MAQQNNDIDIYLKRTGQTYQELMAGLEAYGITEIIEMVKSANEENKTIIWEDDDDPAKLDSVLYSFQDT